MDSQQVKGLKSYVHLRDKMPKKKMILVTPLLAVTQISGKKQAERKGLFWPAVPETVHHVKKEAVAGVM